MSRYAYVQNNEIKEIHYDLPQSWKNISNFRNLANYPNELENLGWKVIQKDTTPFDNKEYKIVSTEYELKNGNVVEKNILEAIPVVTLFQPPVLTVEEIKEQERLMQERFTEEQWSNIRYMRDTAIKDVQWRYERYYRNERLGIEQTDSIQALDTYVQALADVTKQQDPFSITWPKLD